MHGETIKINRNEVTKLGRGKNKVNPSPHTVMRNMSYCRGS